MRPSEIVKSGISLTMIGERPFVQVRRRSKLLEGEGSMIYIITLPVSKIKMVLSGEQPYQG
jgi:hypothetical protein